ncbi:MAG: hypothetical protein R3229_15415 [Alphaproteobacteria bacterium]|nr:hypothetical protein [Alphaproteobacteria bacterium]
MTSFSRLRMAFAGLAAVALSACFLVPANSSSETSDIHVARAWASTPNSPETTYFERKFAPRPGHVGAPSRPSGADDEESIKDAVATNGLGFQKLAQKYVPSGQRLSPKRAFLVPYQTGPPHI